MTRDYKRQSAWKKENQVYIGLTLSKTTDADIIGYVERKMEEGETKQGVVKRCIREAIDREGQHA